MVRSNSIDHDLKRGDIIFFVGHTDHRTHGLGSSDLERQSGLWERAYGLWDRLGSIECRFNKVNDLVAKSTSSVVDDLDCRQQRMLRATGLLKKDMLELM